MRKSVAAIGILAAMICTAVPARADFIKDYRAWQQLGPDGQAAYAMAIFDVMTVFVANDKYTAARAMGLRKCAMAMNLRSGMIAQAINKFYNDYPAQRGVTPFIAFNSYFERGACSPFINEVRQEMGLKPMREAPPVDQQGQGQQPDAEPGETEQ